MSHNNYLLTREGNFVTVSDDELYHWKYIKREKVNGKWRYYYDNDEKRSYNSARNSQALAKKEFDKQIDERNELKAEINTIKETVDSLWEQQLAAGAEYGRTMSDKALAKYYTKLSARMENEKKYEDKKADLNYKNIEFNYARRSYEDAIKHTIAARSAYEKTAGAKVADLLNKSSDKIDKAKSWVSGLFSKKKEDQ